MNPSNRRTRQVGFSLVEMMIALLMGLILFAGVGHLVLGASRSWALQDELSRIQESARLTLDILGQSISTAGYTGCPHQANLANTLSAEQDNRLWMEHFDKGVLGIAGASAKEYVDSSATSEAIVIHRVDTDEQQTVSSHDTSLAKLSLSTGHPYDEGDLLALVTPDCSQISVFRASSATGNSAITHSANNSVLRNCTSHLFGHFACTESAPQTTNASHQGAKLIALDSYAFYLRNSNNMPTLYRKKAGEYQSGNTINAEALVEGVEGLLIRYGVDSDNDGVANQYLLASQIAPFSEEWLSVISVKLEVLVRSFTEIAPAPQSYVFGGQTMTANDRFVRRSFMRTIKLRNRGLQ